MKYFVGNKNEFPYYLDSAVNGHVLIGGASGSGKSVLLNNILINLVESQEECTLFLVDFKMVEFHKYEGANHVHEEIVTDIDTFEALLGCLVTCMENRYKQMLKADVTRYDEIGLNPVFVVIDEFGDIMLQYAKRVKNQLARLLQKARASGIIFIVATQRPEATILPPLIRCNFMTCIATRTRTARESKLILDNNGAEKLNIGECLLITTGVFDPITLYVPYMTNEVLKRRLEDEKNKIHD